MPRDLMADQDRSELLSLIARVRSGANRILNDLDYADAASKRGEISDFDYRLYTEGTWPVDEPEPEKSATESCEVEPPLRDGEPPDNWADLSSFACRTCRFYVPKVELVSGDYGVNDKGEKLIVRVEHKPRGRCRRHAPTMNGFPVVYDTDWCGDHRLADKPRNEDRRRHASE